MENTLDELQSIEEENVFIVDDNFLVSRKRIIDFCDGLDKRNIKKGLLLKVFCFNADRTLFP